MFELLRPMKLLTISVLIMGWLAMGFGVFADQLDSTTLNTVTTGIFADDSDDSPDETKHVHAMELRLPFAREPAPRKSS